LAKKSLQPPEEKICFVYRKGGNGGKERATCCDLCTICRERDHSTDTKLQGGQKRKLFGLEHDARKEPDLFTRGGVMMGGDCSLLLFLCGGGTNPDDSSNDRTLDRMSLWKGKEKGGGRCNTQCAPGQEQCINQLGGCGPPPPQEEKGEGGDNKNLKQSHRYLGWCQKEKGRGKGEGLASTGIVVP